MIRIFRKYRKTVFGVIVVAMASLSMTGFGVNLYSHMEKDRNYAIKVDDTVINHSQFERERNQIQERYRQMFGKNYYQFAKSLEANMNQQVVDKLIADTLLEREARKNELYIGNEEVSNILRAEVFQQGMDTRMYAAILRQLGMTAQEFEQQIRDEALRQAFAGMLSDVSFASTQEAKALWETEETVYSVSHVEFAPAKFEGEVKAPEDKVLQGFYDDHASDYEEPAVVSYDYVVFNPDSFLELVQVTDDDIELYYTDHQADFTDPAQVKARHIQFTYPKAADPKTMADLKEKAQEVLTKAQAGEPFENLAQLYSDDVSTNLSGGDLGWIPKGKMAKEFDAAAFKMKEGEISELVTTDYGFHIIKVEGMKEPEPKKLEDVRAEITKIIQKREAPAYTADHAHQLFEKWDKTELSLPEFAAKNGLTTVATAGPLAEEKDPAADVAGLTKEVLRLSDEPKQLVELKEVTVMVGIKEYKEPRIPPFPEIKTKVFEAYKKAEAKRMAEEASSSFVKAFEGKEENLPALAKAWHLTPVETKDLSRQKGGTGIFANNEIRDAVYSTFTPLEKPRRSYKIGDSYYVLQVQTVQKPVIDDSSEKLLTYRNRAAQANAQTLTASVLNRLKAEAKIDVDPHLLATKES